MRRLVLHYEKCTGCRICELTCSFRCEGAYAPRAARIRMETAGLPELIVPRFCRHCQQPACVEVCPTEAVAPAGGQNVKGTRPAPGGGDPVGEDDGGPGPVTVREEDCTGCGLCVEACPYEAMFMHPARGTAIKCDLCGGDPRCVADCPAGALLFAAGGEDTETAAEKVAGFLRANGLDGSDFLL